MNKWLFPLCMFLAASLLFLAARNNSRPRKPYSIAVLDPAAILEKDPVANRIRLIGEKRKLLQGRMRAAAFAGINGKTSAPSISRDENRRLETGFSEHRKSFIDMAGTHAEERLLSSLGAARAEFDGLVENNYKETLAQLDEIFKRRQPADSGELRQLKLKLFSLHLRYDTLSRDKITSAWHRPDSLKTEIDSLEKEISENEKKSYDEFAKEQIGLTSAARNEFLKTEKQRNEEFEKQMEKALADTRAQTRQAMEKYEVKINAAVAAAAGERKRLFAGIEKGLFPAPGADADPGVKAALKKYEKSFDVLLKKRIAALAVDGEYDIVLSPPLYRAPAAPDLTGRF